LRSAGEVALRIAREAPVTGLVAKTPSDPTSLSNPNSRFDCAAG